MKIDKSMLLWIVIAVLFILVIYVLFFQGAATTTGLTANAGQAAQAYSGMVGGC